MLIILMTKFDAAAGEYEACRLAIRDFLLARPRVEVVSCSAAVVLCGGRRAAGTKGARHTAAETRS